MNRKHVDGQPKQTMDNTETKQYTGSLGTEPGTRNRTVLEPEPSEPAVITGRTGTGFQFLESEPEPPQNRIQIQN